MSESPKKPKAEEFWTTYRLLILDQRISHGAFRLWHYLHNRRDTRNQCWPTQRQIADDIGCKTHSLKEWTSQLQSAGFLHVEQVGQKHNNRYTLLAVNSIGVALPKWATPRDAQKGNTDEFSRCPNGHAALPKPATPRDAQKGNLSNPQVVIPISKGSTAPRISIAQQRIEWREEITAAREELKKLGSLNDHDRNGKNYKRHVELTARISERLAQLDAKA